MSVLEWQASFHQATERFLLLDCGRRTGKSIAGGREAFAQCFVPGSLVWIVGPDLDLAEKEFRVVWELAVTKGAIPVRRKSERELFIAFDNGSFIECRSEEQPDQLIGEGVDLVVMAEAARMSLRTWHQYVRPTLADRKGRAIFSSTPRGYNWFYDFFMRGQPTAEGGDQEEYPQWRSWKLPTMANPLIDDEEIEDMRRTLSDVAFRQEVLAEFVAYGGQVFPEFDINVHVRAHQYDPGLPTYLWIDPGITNPYCVLLVQITPDETVRVLDEIYVTGRVTDQIIDAAEMKWPYALFIPGSRLPKPDLTIVVDEAAAEAIAGWRLRGYPAVGQKGKPSVPQGIEVHHRMLRDPYRTVEPTLLNPTGIVPRITFDPRCKNTVREHSLYHYPDEARKRVETNVAELPVPVDDHSIAAIRYGYANAFPELFNVRPETEEFVYVSTDDMLRQFGNNPDRMRIEAGYSFRGAPDEEVWSLGRE